MNKFECITACVGFFLLALVISTSAKACYEYNVKRMELGYPDPMVMPQYPKSAKKEDK